MEKNIQVLGDKINLSHPGEVSDHKKDHLSVQVRDN